MNLYFVHDDGTIVTPATSGTILEGITRSSIIELCGKLGHRVEERAVHASTSGATGSPPAGSPRCSPAAPPRS